MIKAYTILKVIDKESELSRIVMQHIEKGWKLYGSPFASSWTQKEREFDETFTEYCQAMIKESDDE